LAQSHKPSLLGSLAVGQLLGDAVGSGVADGETGVGLADGETGVAEGERLAVADSALGLALGEGVVVGLASVPLVVPFELSVLLPCSQRASPTAS
jgi:hypothetical protein